MAGLLAGKIAIVAGAELALGAAIARAFVEHGAKVVASEKLDPRDPDSWRRAVAKARAQFGRLTTLVNAAPDPGRADVEATSEIEWDATLDADLRGPWLGMKHCMPAIRDSGGGAVINTSATAATVGTGHSAAYHAAMAGVLMLSRTAAIEYAPQNIRVNAVLVGPLDPSLLDGLAPQARETLMALTPMKRLGTAGEIAGAYVFLASDLASYVTGTGLVVDGGYTAA